MSISKRAHTAPALPDNTFGFIFYSMAQFRGWLCLMLFFETGQAAGNILVPYGIKGIMDAVATMHGEPIFPTLQQPLTVLVLIILAEIISSRASGAVLIITGPRLRQRTTQNLFTYLQYHSVRYFGEHFAGGLAHRITETAVSVNHTTWSILCDFWPITVTFAVSVGLLVNVHQDLGLFVAAWVLVYIVSSFLLAKRCQPYAKEFAAARSLVNGKIVDSVTNILNAKLFARLAYERAYLNEYLEKELKTSRKTFWFMERIRWFQFIAAAILKIGTIYYGLTLWESGVISVADFTMSIGLALLIISDAKNLTRRFLEFFEYVGNVSNGVETIIRNHEIIDAADAKPLFIRQGQVEFKQVSFAYDADRLVFNNLNVLIKPGERVGLVGLSGSGKSTFVSLILRNYQLQSGRIVIDDVDIATVTQDSLHEQISLIPQDPSLFHRSLKENIAYGKLNASDEEVIAAAKLAHADEFISTMNQGYDALVGERGVKLSGGQRQRIAIARVMLKDAPILILDEATASLDSVTEKTIQENLESVMGKKTVIAIAHRLSTIAHLDRILVFDQGQIVEDGSHEDLLHRKGLYHQLWARQAGGFLPE